MPVDLIVSVILITILGGVIFYIVRSKKRGDVCVGCPHAKQCKRGGACGSQEKKL